MSVKSTNLGYPRIALHRELKKATESYWKGMISESDLQKAAKEIRQANWEIQKNAGIDIIPSNDFSFYDQTLDMCAMLGAVPKRFNWNNVLVDIDTYFAMARGTQEKEGVKSNAATAMEMTKWFDTNYHYIVPEFHESQTFRLSSRKVFDEFQEARNLGIVTKPVLLGPISFLLLGKSKDAGFSPLGLLDQVLAVYEHVLMELGKMGAQWIQIDEPALVLDLTPEAKAVYPKTYARLRKAAVKSKILLATYFGDLRDNLSIAVSLAVDALHVDLCRAPGQLDAALKALPKSMTLSCGVVDGRNIWTNDLDASLKLLEKAKSALGPDRLLVAPSCSLLHSPLDLEAETKLDTELKSWMAFAKQKLLEISALTEAINGNRSPAAQVFDAHAKANASRKMSKLIHVESVKKRAAAVTPEDLKRESAFAERQKTRRDRLKLPLFPTTTIGSFPQTTAVRSMRAKLKNGELTQAQYDSFITEQIKTVVKLQEDIGLDVLAHGEFERNDMVEYFGEQLDGYCFTSNGWVQSFGSRYVKPPIIFGDVSRPKPMTVHWAKTAQGCSQKPVKGMLTGPITMLQWSFVRDDQPRSETAWQLALAVRDEVRDLENAGISVIQIDEPALREGLPLRRADWDAYLAWSVDAFRLAVSCVKDETQIHTHMCYGQFQDIMEAIARLDADVISIETSRSDMELLYAFAEFKYPNEIGPGVYDIHSPRVPAIDEMVRLLEKAAQVLPARNLWVNPDCGLKTRSNEEVVASLKNMVEAAKKMREKVPDPMSIDPPLVPKKNCQEKIRPEI